jgi:hypothetical protein
MAIIFATNTLAGFDGHANVTAETTAAYLNTDNGLSDTLMLSKTSAILSRDIAPLDEGWFHEVIYLASGDNFYDEALIRFRDSTGQILFSVEGYNGVAKIWVYYASSNTQSTTTAIIPEATKFAVDIHFKIHATDGFIRLYIDKVLMVEMTGDTKKYGTNVSKINVLNTNTNGNMSVSEVILATEDTRGMKVRSIKPNAAGNDSGFIGAVADVNHTGPNDLSMITADTADVVTTYALAAPPQATALGVRGVVVNSRASRGATGPQNLNHVVRSGGANYHGADIAMSEVFKSYSTVFETNPATGLPFTWAELDALQAGVRSRA